jgi:hypothetical protein
MKYPVSKYNAVPTVVDNIRFASKREANRYYELKVLQKAGEITDLKCQPRFPLVVRGTKICTYVADFSYRNKSGELVVEDVKSKPTMTPAFRLKAKLLQAVEGITVSVVM